MDSELHKAVAYHCMILKKQNNKEVHRHLLVEVSLENFFPFRVPFSDPLPEFYMQSCRQELGNVNFRTNSLNVFFE